MLGQIERSGDLQTPAQSIAGGTRPMVSWFHHATEADPRKRIVFGRIEALSGDAETTDGIERLSCVSEARWVSRRQ